MQVFILNGLAEPEVNPSLAEFRMVYHGTWVRTPARIKSAAARAIRTAQVSMDSHFFLGSRGWVLALI